MGYLPSRGSRSRVVERLALTGMALAVVALGALALWAAVVTQNNAAGLSEAGVQTSGHLRALQAVNKIDTETDLLGEDSGAHGLGGLRKAQLILDDALERMERGGLVEDSRIAREARPRNRALEPAIQGLLAAQRSRDPDRLESADDRADNVVEGLQLLLNDVREDPSQHLTAKLEAVTDLERAVRRTALVLVPLGLGLVVMCAWLLRTSRRRSEAALRGALELSSHEARTDPLTSLANRRALMEELERHIEDEEPFTLALADLDGFKQYNDTYGHAAGDALLRRLAGKLQESCASHGTTARLGGDEFCILFPPNTPFEVVTQCVCEALSEGGEGFRITAGCGVVRVPEEASSVEAALRLADIRMYAAKVESRPTVEHVMSRVLVQMLEERHPGLGPHVEEVAELAASCAETLGLGEQEVGQVRRAAELHDIGKLAIPESILKSPEPLSDEDWDFMRRHTVVGERVLALVPSLGGVATLVRASHERWDGTGYPDQLAGHEIPVGARIITIADAFAAMTAERPYAAARSVESALAELRACSGTQFDPVAVEAFAAALLARATALGALRAADRIGVECFHPRAPLPRTARS